MPRLRQLFRYVKFHQLMHLARRDGPWLEITLDGPASLFKQSTRYGMELATFFPAILLQECPWELQATVLWTKAKHRKTLTLTHEDGLVGHYADRGAYQLDCTNACHCWCDDPQSTYCRDGRFDALHRQLRDA